MESSKEQIVAKATDLTSADLDTEWTYKGKQYQIVTLVQMKDPHDSNWYQGIIYKDIANWEGLCYARYESDFLAKFRRVETEDQTNG